MVQRATPLLAVLLLATLTAGQIRPVTDNPREFTNLNVETTRGVLWSAIDARIYGLNTNLSQVAVYHDLNDGLPDERWQTLLYPTAVADWEDRVLVVAAGSHALAIHARAGGAVLDVIPLPSEPADIVVDPDNDFAFVSCQGANSLVQIDLNTLVKVEIPVPAERPRFLFFDRGTDETSDNRVFVAPFLSGNNTTFAQEAMLTPAATVEQNLGSVVTVANPPLPDEDLFVLSSTTMNPGLQAVVTGAGTLLTAHGLHPNGNYWMLGVESLNQDPVLDTEPELNGVFARNQAWIGDLLDSSPPPVFVDLDDIDPTSSVSYTATTSLAFPFGIAFHPLGFVAVSASMSDRIGAFDALGQRVPALDINLPAGSIPRHIQFDPFVGQFLAIHCWGTNTILVKQVGLPLPPVVLQLGLDPLPPLVKEGREIWYDADRSRFGRTSCNTCHPGGKADLLAWSLSDPPHDHKDPMVTQSLLSIEDTFPYHWRGERDLLGFNGAFTNLLGGTAKLTTGGANPEFPKFQAFVFSLQAQANPFAHLSRTLNSPPDADVTNGLNLYVNTPTFPPANPVFSCNDCHALPTGTSGDWQLEELSFVPSETTFEVAHFRELRHKDQPVVAGGHPRNGFGLRHDGAIHNLLAATGPFALNDQEDLDMVSFLRQFDQGISPAAHAALFLNSATQSTVSGVLQPQVQNGWIDVVAFGKVTPPSSSTAIPARWLFDPVTGMFQANEAAVAPMTLTQLTPGPVNSTAGVVVLGVPVGNGRRFALDPDNDDLIDSSEPSLASRFDPDSDKDGFPDGFEVQNGSSPTVFNSSVNDTTDPSFTTTPRNGFPSLDFVTASVAKFFVEASEDSRVHVVFEAPPDVPPRTFLSADFGRRHTVVLQGLDGTFPNPRNYTAKFALVDRAGRTSPAVTVPFSTRPIVANPSGRDFPPESIRATSFTSNPPVRAGNTLTFTNTKIQLEVRVPNASSTPSVVGKRVVVQVLVRPAGTSAWQVSSTATSPNATVMPSFWLTGIPIPGGGSLPFLILPGPFVVSNSVAADGIASCDIVQPNLSTGDEVKINIVAILGPAVPPPPGGDAAPTFAGNSSGLYQMPATPAAARAISEIF